MSERLEPRFLELVNEAALAAFWYRRALTSFLRRCGVSERTLAQWDGQTTKREWLDRLFPRLEEREDGRRIVVRMAEALAEMSSFPDLQGVEDSTRKQDKAAKAVAELRSYLSQERDEKEREKARAEGRARLHASQQEAAKSRATLEGLSSRLADLCKILGTQKGGYAFQDWFYDFLDFSEVQCRRPYVHGGRQHDGSITIEGTTYIVELKFTAGQCDVGEIDSLRAKVEEKADNTMGMLVSMSGFTSVAVSQSSGRRTPLLLMDSGHIYMALTGIRSFGEVLLRCRRHAAQTGDAYLPVDKFNG